MKNVKYAFRALKMLVKKYPIYILLEIILALSLVVCTVIPVRMIDYVIKIYQEGLITFDSNFSDFMNNVGYYIITRVAILIGLSLLNLIIGFAETYIERGFSVYVATNLFRKLDSIDYENHEQDGFLDNYTRALTHGDIYIYNTAKGQINFVKTIIQSISIFAIIFEVHYLAVVYALIIGVVYYFIRRKIGKVEFRLRSETAPKVRKREYVRRVMYVKDSMADIKTTPISDVLLDYHRDIGKEIIDDTKKFMNIKTIFNSLAGILLSSIYPVILAVVCYFVLENNDLATLSSLTVAATILSNLITNMANGLSSIQNDVLECKVSFELLDMESKIEGIKKNDITDEFKQLIISNISFGYDSNQYVLKNIDFHIKKGEKIAIVGENGAGKTTLVKLLLRLYDVSEGKILYNDTAYTDITPVSLRKKVGAVFQNSEVYSVSIAENVLLRKCQGKEDEELVIRALKFSDLYDYVCSLEDGIHTMVTREFHRRGTIFSGGQTQKLAVARGYAQNYDLFILDEPSSALDPIAETKMYHNMLELGKDKTLIFISHRLSAAVNVDRIYLFENGKIVEQGSHEDLLKIKNGKYREMFLSQSEKYLRGSKDV